MEENPSRVSRNSNNGGGNRATTVASKQNPYPVEDGGDPVECSGKYCKSCTAGLIADCVAVCCCPCALVNLLALAFVKVPYMVGRRCLGIGKKKGRNKQKLMEMKRGCRRNESGDCVVERNGNLEKVRVEEGMSEIIASGFGLEEEMDNVCAGFEAEKVWFEMYQVGHLGFGRVSFTGIQSQGKGN